MQQPVRLHSGEWLLSATVYGAGPRSLLILPPLAEERKGATRPIALLARRMTSKGWRVILFDYYGTGDSPGQFEEVTWESLRRDTDAALQLATEQTSSVSILGVRSGARLAIEASSDRRISAICLWEPVLSGGKWYREVKRRSRFRHGSEVAGNDIDGYLFSESLVASLEEQTQNPDAPGVPTLVIGIGSKTKPDRKLQEIAAVLDATATSVTMPPFWLETGVVEPEELLAQTARYFEDT